MHTRKHFRSKSATYSLPTSLITPIENKMKWHNKDNEIYFFVEISKPPHLKQLNKQTNKQKAAIVI